MKNPAPASFLRYCFGSSSTSKSRRKGSTTISPSDILLKRKMHPQGVWATEIDAQDAKPSPGGSPMRPTPTSRRSGGALSRSQEIQQLDDEYCYSALVGCRACSKATIRCLKATAAREPPGATCRSPCRGSSLVRSRRRRLRYRRARRRRWSGVIRLKVGSATVYDLMSREGGGGCA
jgi:hypothetical protein